MKNVLVLLVFILATTIVVFGVSCCATTAKTVESNNVNYDKICNPDSFVSGGAAYGLRWWYHYTKDCKNILAINSPNALHGYGLLIVIIDDEVVAVEPNQNTEFYYDLEEEKLQRLVEGESINSEQWDERAAETIRHQCVRLNFSQE